MLDALADFARTLPTVFATSYATGLLINGSIIAVVYLVVWKLLARRLRLLRIQLERRADAAQIKREIRNAFVAAIPSALLSCVMVYLATHGHTRIYFNLSDHHVLIGLAGFPLLLLVNDAWFYWVHRILHHPRIYKYVHAEHHRSIDVNPLTSLSFHWLEPLLLTLWIVPAALLMPVWAPVLGLLQVYGLYDNIKSHLGYELYPRWFNRSPLRVLTSSTYHNMHHTNFRGNFGLHFRIWDRLMGTEIRTYEPTFDGIKTRAGDLPDGAPTGTRTP
jgi:Delta7-sterol 5-desaturase